MTEMAAETTPEMIKLVKDVEQAILMGKAISKFIAKNAKYDQETAYATLDLFMNAMRAEILKACFDHNKEVN